MILKQTAYCTVRNMTVETLVEETKVGGRKATVQRTPLTCARMAECPRTTFCRFVNPLTTRVPLEASAPAPRAEAS